MRAVSAAGGLPVLIPLTLSQEEVSSLVSRLAGVLLTGGCDLHPSHYGINAHPLVREVDPERDRLELSLAQEAVQSGKPFLGICRGLQVLNVALGGSLYPDIQACRPGSLKHDYFPDPPRDYLAHTVAIQPGSRLEKILAERSLQINSLHHQGIERLAAPLRATAHAPDGLIEAVELPGHNFGLAVQWHPEWLQEYEPMRRLFRAFVQAAED